MPQLFYTQGTNPHCLFKLRLDGPQSRSCCFRDRKISYLSQESNPRLSIPYSGLYTLVSKVNGYGLNDMESVAWSSDFSLLHTIETSPGSYLPSEWCHLLLRGKLAVHRPDVSPLSSIKVKNAWNCYLHSFMAVVLRWPLRLFVFLICTCSDF
jgi:hypothetical protein